MKGMKDIISEKPGRYLLAKFHRLLEKLLCLN